MGEPGKTFSVDVGCKGPADCSIAWVPVDCCGTSRATGVAKAAEPHVLRQLAECREVPSCECLAQSTLLDNGERADEPQDIALECRRGRCVTRSNSDAR